MNRSRVYQMPEKVIDDLLVVGVHPDCMMNRFEVDCEHCVVLAMDVLDRHYGHIEGMTERFGKLADDIRHDQMNGAP